VLLFWPINDADHNISVSIAMKVCLLVIGVSWILVGSLVDSTRFSAVFDRLFAVAFPIPRSLRLCNALPTPFFISRSSLVSFAFLVRRLAHEMTIVVQSFDIESAGPNRFDHCAPWFMAVRTIGKSTAVGDLYDVIEYGSDC
jgi:hypothetical protein